MAGYKIFGGAGGVVSSIVNFPAKLFGGFKQYTRLILVEGNKLFAGFVTTLSPFAVKTQQVPGLNWLQYTLDVDHQSYVTTATQSAGGDWDDIANSEAAEDSTYSRLVEGLVLTQGTLIGDFPDQTDRDSLTINKVAIRCYYQVSEFLLAGSSLTVQYQVGLTPVTLETHTGGIILPTNVNRLSGYEFDITASGPDGIGGAWTWSDINDLQIQYNGTILLDAGLSLVRVDASRLEIEASLTEAL